MVPNYWGEFNRLISVLLQVLFKSVMCNYYRLCNTINYLLNLDIDSSIVCNVTDVTFIENLIGYYIKGQLHVFVTFHWCVEKKTIYICTQNMESDVEMMLLVRVLDVVIYTV